MKCPHCGQEHPGNTKFCPETGNKIEHRSERASELIACINIDCEDYGKKILPADSRFCPTCGRPVTSEGLSEECKVLGFIELDNNEFAFIDKEGKVIPELECCYRLNSEFISGEYNCNFYEKNNEVFSVSNEGVVSYGECEANPINEHLVEILKDDGIFSKIYDSNGTCVYGNLKTRGIIKIIDNKLLIGMVGKDSYGIIDLENGRAVTKFEVDINDIRNVSTCTKFDLVAASGYEECFYHVDIDSLSLVRHALPFQPRKLYVLDNQHVLIHQIRSTNWYIYNVNGDKIAYSSKTPTSFGDVVVMEDERTFYLKNHCMSNYPISIQIGHYGIIDDVKLGLVDLETGSVVIEQKYDYASPIFNNAKRIRFIYFSCYGYKNKECVAIFDTETGRIFTTDIKDYIQMIAQQDENIFLFTKDGVSCIYDTDFNVKFRDDWGEYSTVIPMNDKMYYLKQGEFGILDCNNENPIFKVNANLLFPLYGIEKILIINDDVVDGMCVVFDPITQERHECKFQDLDDLMASSDDKFGISLYHYLIVHKCLLQWDHKLVEDLKEYSHHEHFPVKGLIKINQQWENIFYPHYYSNDKIV